MLFFLIILINYLFYSSSSIELLIHKSLTEIRQNFSGNEIFTYTFNNNEYENIIDDSIHWTGTPFLKQELYTTIDTLQNALVTVKQSTTCDCKIVQAKILDPNTMLLENLETGTYFYADKYLIEYKSKRPNSSSTKLTFSFGNTSYNGTLSYLMKGITWSPSYDLFLTNSQTCNLQGYATIRNKQQQEYDVNNTYLFSGDLQLIKSFSSSNLQTSIHSGLRDDNATSKSIQFDNEEKGFYSYSLNIPYKLRPLSTNRFPFINITLQCQFYYKAITSIHNGEYKGVFQRYYNLLSNQFLPAGILTIRDNQVLIGQTNLPDIPQNYTHTITLGQDHDVRYSIKSNLTATNQEKTKDKSYTYLVDVTISNLKQKTVKTQMELHGSTRIILHKTTCSSGKIDGNMFILSIELKQNEIYQCQLNVTLK